MSKTANRLHLIDTMMNEAVQKGLLQLTVESDTLDGRLIHLAGRPLINFGVCSYLGLEMDSRLKQGAIDAVLRYGTQFASSRGYLSAPPYRELEHLLQRIVDAPVLVTPTTTLGHLAALPVLIEEGDAVLMDQQVHNSVQMAVEHVRARGIPVEIVRHNDISALEARLCELSIHYQRIWYLADGVYSMFGDLTPVAELSSLLRRFQNLHLYLDDAHGMSWTGPHGCGYVLSHLTERKRAVVALSMAKGFGVGGGVLVFPDAQSQQRVRNCGGPMLFSGPIQPPLLGAAIASAHIHLSEEITEMQQQLLERIRLCNDLMQQKALPLVSSSMTPIRFVATGWTRVAHNLMHRLMEDGFFPNIVGFPAVPLKQSGIRITITRHHREDDIRCLVDALAYHLPLALQEEGSGFDDIAKFFHRSLTAPVIGSGLKDMLIAKI
ncbi:MAG TPA: aminotransferase class I/II-fold pyridoxal phosphate-dependent enzyme [Ktedonobacteraceae bacterium]